MNWKNKKKKNESPKESETFYRKDRPGSDVIMYCIFNILLFNQKFLYISSLTQSEPCYIYKSALNIFDHLNRMCFSKSVKLLFNFFSFLSDPLFSAHITDLSYKCMYINTYDIFLCYKKTSIEKYSENEQQQLDMVKVSSTLTTSQKKKINWTICNIAQSRGKIILLYANHNELVLRSIVLVLQYFTVQCLKFLPNRLLSGSYLCAYYGVFPDLFHGVKLLFRTETR